MLEKISETNNWIFLKIKNIDRPLALLAKRVLEGIIKISNKSDCYHLQRNKKEYNTTENFHQQIR